MWLKDPRVAETTKKARSKRTMGVTAPKSRKTEERNAVINVADADPFPVVSVNATDGHPIDGPTLKLNHEKNVFFGLIFVQFQ